MRKTLKEKIEIVKLAKTKKLIKKLSVQHGITTKTINSWIEAYKAGTLNGEKSMQPDCGSKTKTASPPFSEAVFKVITVYSVLEDKTVYRYMLKDINNRLMLCTYTLDNSNGYSEKVLKIFLSDLHKSGIIVKNITTDKRNHLSDMKEFKTTVIYAHNDEIKKYLSFSTKNNSFIKERTRYENPDDFLFDSMATVAKNNDIAYDNFTSSKDLKLIETVNKLNMNYHSVILSKEAQNFEEKKANDLIISKFNLALEFHKKIDFGNAEALYRKIEYILKNSGLNIELYIKNLIQIGKVYGLRKDLITAKKYFTLAMNMSDKLPPDKINGFKYNLYMLFADLYRVSGDNKKCIYHFEKAKKMAEIGSDVNNKALILINYSIYLRSVGKLDKVEEYLDKAEVISEDNNLSDILLAVKESKADFNVKRGNTSEASKIYEKMIAEDVYKNMLVQKIILFARYGDCLQLAGTPGRSIEMYDRSIELIDKSDRPASLMNIRVPVSGNKAVAYIKINEFQKAAGILEENIELSQNNNFKGPLIDNTLNLCCMEIFLNNLKEAKNRLESARVLLENTESPMQKYNVPLYSGMIHKKEKKYEKAEEEMLSAVDITKSITVTPLPYFKTILELIELYIESGNLKKASDYIEDLNSNAKSSSNRHYSFISDVLSKKTELYKTQRSKEYKTYLSVLLNKKSYDTEEQMYFLMKERDFL
jgi:tetratricopeptide (TPR) repeat protein